MEPPSRDYPGQTSLGAWVADKLRERGLYEELEEQVLLAYSAEVIDQAMRHASPYAPLNGDRRTLE
jgi:hypothetical protein